jgi:putative GTP pyrophosphokinase
MDIFLKMNSAVDQYRANYHSYVAFASRLAGLVSELIKQSRMKVHFIESRAKTPESFAEKIVRPGKEYKNPFTEIPDLVGVRVVLYYSDNVKFVGDLLKREFDILEEESSHQPTAYGADQFGYLSMHYVAKMHAKRNELPEWVEWRDVQAEIQVRTVLQHSWAAVSHALQYKREGDVPLSLRRRLHRLAGLFELADEEFVGIRDEAGMISAVTQVELQNNPDVAPIDAQTVTHFLQEAPIVKRAHHEAALLGYRFGSPDGLPDEDHDRTDYIAALVETSHRLGFGIIGDLKREINFDAKPFLKNVQGSGEWYVSDAFLIFLLLIKAKPEAFTVDILVAEGFAASIAERVLKAANTSK